MSKATRAQATIDTHEKVCVERYGNIDKQLTEIKGVLTAQSIQYNDRFNALSARMWTVLMASLGGTVVGLSGVVFYLLTKGH